VSSVNPSGELYLSGVGEQADQMAGATRRFAAVMFTDMVGYTYISQKSEMLAMRLLQKQRDVVRSCVSRHGGMEIKTIGDGFLIEFGSALEAVSCAITIQNDIHAKSLGAEPGESVVLRIGINAGEVIPDQGDIYGDTVNLASRVESQAEPGGICFTERVYNDIKNRLDSQFEYVGGLYLKNVLTPLNLYKVVLPFKESLPEHMASSVANRIVVLPLSNADPSDDGDYFIDGLTDELTAALSGIHELRVISRDSAVRYRASTKPITQIARELNVGLVLVGNMRKASNSLRVSLRLVDTQTDEQIWAKTWERPLPDIFLVQSDIVKNIAEELRTRIVEKAGRGQYSPPSRSFEAYDFYLRGRHALNQGIEGPEKAVTFFRLALKEDPKLAQAYSALSDYYTYVADETISGDVAFGKAKENAREALTLNPRLSEAHTSLAIISFEFDWDWKAAEREFKEALSLNSNNAFAHHWYALFLKSMRRFDDALVEIERANVLDPLSSYVMFTSAVIHWNNRQTELAAKDCTRSVELSFENAAPHSLMGLIFLSKGDRTSASREALLAAQHGGVAAIRGYSGLLFGKLGMKKEALRVLEGLPKTSDGRPEPYAAALVYVGLGERETAIGQFREAYVRRSTWLPLFNGLPELDEMSTHPGYASIMREMGLP
jgi:class 3 adenylate cyclase/tetratricopeptide (TPR) repeat protein